MKVLGKGAFTQSKRVQRVQCDRGTKERSARQRR